ncbi:hypothetical protein LNA02_08010 [Levilactobacillus namurensis]|nr:hypothetical protein LNA02_08010 [Levilactobacillus namurensis]
MLASDAETEAKVLASASDWALTLASLAETLASTSLKEASLPETSAERLNEASLIDASLASAVLVEADCD